MEGLEKPADLMELTGFPKTEGGFPRRQRPTGAAGERGMEPVSGDPLLRELLRFAVRCRALALLLQAVFNLLIPDHAADAFSPPRLSEPGPADLLLERLLGGLSRWDAEHFLFIAERGYLYEHNCAFFPLYPLSLRAGAEAALWPLRRLLRLRSRLLLSAALLNSLFAILAAAALYKLGCAVLRCRRAAFLATALFCVSPANVFLAAAYSESMFCCLAFGAMWRLERGQRWRGALLFSLATGARANGVVNAGFLLYSCAKRLALRLRLRSGSLLLWKQLLSAASSAVACAGVLLPFVVFQYYAYMMFCVPNVQRAVPEPLLQLALDKGYRLAGARGAPPPWCSQRFPAVYPYIQDVYWNVGFLRYFELRQIPNFLLALPVTLLSSWAAWTYVSANPRHCLTLGLERTNSGEENKASAGFCGPAVFVYMVHATALLLLGFFCMHVQVLTRFLGSSSPILYWFSAHLLQEHEPLLWSDGTDGEPASPGGGRPGSRGDGAAANPVLRLLSRWSLLTPLSKCVLGFFLSYWLLGLLLHCNFLPWT
ncbi:GPI mannosyltransferase 2 isoform X4 [Columba livia]|uniref:GPI mannosyltransferase 2 isoform X4 n=2 Tax=Columba livia TaxID=8932 RepID=UPI0031BB792E